MVARHLVEQPQMLTWSVLGPLCVVGLECNLHKAVDREEIRSGEGGQLVGVHSVSSPWRVDRFIHRCRDVSEDQCMRPPGRKRAGAAW